MRSLSAVSVSGRPRRSRCDLGNLGVVAMVRQKYGISFHYFDSIRSDTNTAISRNSRVLTIMTSRSHQLNDAMLRQYGPLIGGADLRKALGFRTAATFQRAVREKTLNVPVFDVPGRRGKFALTVDIAIWITTVSDSDHQSGEPQPSTAGCIGKGGGGNTNEEAKM